MPIDKDEFKLGDDILYMDSETVVRESDIGKLCHGNYSSIRLEEGIFFPSLYRYGPRGGYYEGWVRRTEVPPRVCEECGFVFEFAGAVSTSDAIKLGFEVEKPEPGPRPSPFRNPNGTVQDGDIELAGDKVKFD